MARGFGSTFGTSNTTDRIVGGTSITLGTTVSVSAWAYRNGAGGNSVGGIFDVDDGTKYMDLYFGSISTSFLFERDWSTAASTWRTPTNSFPTGSWKHICVTYDGSSSSNVPVMYINGASQTITTVTAPTGTLSSISGVPRIGNDGTAVDAWDGNLAEIGFWNNTILTANEALALSQGTLPFNIRNSALTLYCPLLGVPANEPDWGPNHYAMTVTGAKNQNHSPSRIYSNALQRGTG